MADSVINVAALGQARAGLNAEDFDTIVVDHQRGLYRLLLGLTRDPDTAATLTQDCFVRAYENRRSFRGEASVKTWLTRIAVNLAREEDRGLLARQPVNSTLQAVLDALTAVRL